MDRRLNRQWPPRARAAQNLVASTIWLAGLIFILSTLAGITGCRAAPDLSPFSSATADLSSSIKVAGRAVSKEIDTTSAAWPPDQRARAIDIANRFQSQWAARDAVADALAEYSASLAAIVASGADADQQARALADALSHLCDAIDIALPPARAGELTIRVGASIYGTYSRDRAARTLAQSMRDMQPPIEELAAALDADLASIATALDALRDQAAPSIDEQTIDNFQPRRERAALRTLTARQSELRAQLQSLADTTEPAGSSISPSRAAALAELSAVESSITLSLLRLAPINTRITETQTRLDQERELVGRTRTGLATWAATHARIAQAADTPGPPRVEDLIQAAIDIRSLAASTNHDKPPGG